jgi:hypothetical protein
VDDPRVRGRSSEPSSWPGCSAFCS